MQEVRVCKDGRRTANGNCSAAITQGATAPTVLNAANEVAVEAFLGGRLAFGQISEVIASVLDRATGGILPAATELDAVLRMDDWARDNARAAVSGSEGTTCQA